ncbi:hypothetical protein VFPPC_14187 [Pochonia chlamydosporia 170]|uniref:Uncharacterized protein n=1 Tax=Pochonia chlamydosporia 170 TaxID=1380566 RepID=A0A179F9G9_METCM|nr:hypothetical protein VFPPC_14187 [Pochonia chlamydosporia 170]OAQ62088.1 hypothetical protein VFPPC_14187 [Pochonia chlamydosporia 170]
MEHRDLWPGREPEPEPEPEHLGHLPTTQHVELPARQLPSSSTLPIPYTLPISDRRCIELGAISDSRRPNLYLRQRWTQPIESLVQRLRNHSLRSRGSYADARSDSTNMPVLRHHGRIFRALRRSDHDLMDFDQHQDVVRIPPTLVKAPAETPPLGNQTPSSASSTLTHYHQFQAAALQPESQVPPTTAHITSMRIITEVAETHSHGPLVEVDSKPDLGCDDLDLDEGYGDGTDDFAWTNDGRSLIQSLANHARKSGALKYRTSAEAAMECSQIVHKVPRMRRRRHKKNQTRLRASSTASTCAFDSQNFTSSIGVNERVQLDS